MIWLVELLMSKCCDISHHLL